MRRAAGRPASKDGTVQADLFGRHQNDCPICGKPLNPKRKFYVLWDPDDMTHTAHEDTGRVVYTHCDPVPSVIFWARYGVRNPWSSRSERDERRLLHTNTIADEINRLFIRDRPIRGETDPDSEYGRWDALPEWAKRYNIEDCGVVPPKPKFVAVVTARMEDRRVR